MPTSHLHAEICSNLGLHRVCAWCGTCCEFLCIAALLWPEDIVSVESPTISGSHALSATSSSMIPEPRLGGLWYVCVLVRAEQSAISYSWPVAGLSVNHYLLQIEVSQMRVERRH